MKAYWDSRCIAPVILTFGARCRWVVILTPRLLYLLGKSFGHSLNARPGGNDSLANQYADSLYWFPVTVEEDE
jgi:hypothetical protein